MSFACRIISRLKSALLPALMLGMVAAPAMAQVERLPFRGSVPGGEDVSGARFIKPGALLLASFDADHDLIITADEIDTGAELAFTHVDTDGSGGISPIEQRNWAARLTSEADVLGNPSLFVSATPGQVSPKEFAAGMHIFAQRFADEEGVISFSAFTFEPKQRSEERNAELDDDLDRLRRPTVAQRPQAGGAQ